MQEQFNVTGLDPVPARPLPQPQLLTANPAQRLQTPEGAGVDGGDDDSIAVPVVVAVVAVVIVLLCTLGAVVLWCMRRNRGADDKSAPAAAESREVPTKEESDDTVVQVNGKAGGGGGPSFMDLRMPPPPFVAAFAMTESESSQTQTTSKGISGAVSGTPKPPAGGSHGSRPPPAAPGAEAPAAPVRAPQPPVLAKPEEAAPAAAATAAAAAPAGAAGTPLLPPSPPLPPLAVPETPSVPTSLRDQAALRSGSDAGSGKEHREHSHSSSGGSGGERPRPPSGGLRDSQGRLRTRTASGGRVTVGAMPNGKAADGKEVDSAHQAHINRISAEKLIATPVADTEELERARARTVAKEAWIRETAAAGRATAAAEATAAADRAAVATAGAAAPAAADATERRQSVTAAAAATPPLPPPPVILEEPTAAVVSTVPEGAAARTVPYEPESDAPRTAADGAVAGTPRTPTESNTDDLDPTGGVPVVGATSEWPPLPTPATALRPIATSVKSSSTQSAKPSRIPAAATAADTAQKAGGVTPPVNPATGATPPLDRITSDTPTEALVWPPAAPRGTKRGSVQPQAGSGTAGPPLDRNASGRQFPAAWSMHRAPGEPRLPGDDSDTASSDSDVPPRPSAAYAPFHNNHNKEASGPRALRDVHALISKTMSHAMPLQPESDPAPGTIATPASAPADPAAAAAADAPAEAPRSLQRMLSPLSRRSEAPASPFRTNCPPSPESHPYAHTALPASISSIPELNTGSPSAHTPRTRTPLSAGRLGSMGGGAGAGAGAGGIQSHLSDPTLLAAIVSPSPGFPAPVEVSSGTLPPDLVHSLSDNPGKPARQDSPPNQNPTFEHSFIVSLPGQSGSETDGTPPSPGAGVPATVAAVPSVVQRPAAEYAQAGAPSASYDSLFGSINGMPMPPRSFAGPMAAAAEEEDEEDGDTTQRGREATFGIVLQGGDSAQVSNTGAEVRPTPPADSMAVGVRSSIPVRTQP